MNWDFSNEYVQMDIRRMKECSASLIIREMQLKTMMRHHLTYIIMASTENSNDEWWWGCEGESLFTLGETLNWYSYMATQALCGDNPYSNHNTCFSEPTSGYISQETKPVFWKDIWTAMFLAALSIIAKKRKQPICLKMDK